MGIRDFRTGSTRVQVLEDLEVARMRSELELATAALRGAYDRQSMAVARAVVEAGCSWADVAEMVWGTRDRVWVDRCRADFREVVEDYRAGVRVQLVEDLAPVVRLMTR
jgi:hypothetical protein